MEDDIFEVYLGKTLADKVRLQAGATGRSAASLIYEAVRERFDDDPAAAQAHGAQRSLDRLERRIDGFVRDQNYTQEILLLFVRVWLEHNPPLEEAMEEFAAQSASARFARFCDLVLLTPQLRQLLPGPLLKTAEAHDAEGGIPSNYGAGIGI